MVSFNFSYQPGTTLQQMIGFEIAGRVWSNYLTDSTTLNIHVGTSSSLAPGVLGGALPGFKTGVTHQSFDMAGLRTYMQADAVSSDDQTAFNTIANRTHFSDFNKYNSSGQLEYEEWADGTTVSMTRANAKALGIPVDSAASLDGYIVMNSNVRNAAGQSIPWNYSYTSTSVPTNSIDFVSVAIHEIGHLLGFVSGVDRPWEVSPTSIDATGFSNSLVERVNEATPLDLLRTTQYTYGGRNYPSLNWSVGGTQFLSLDYWNSSTALGYFATGKDQSLGGNGSQASHWRGDAGSSGMMNAFLGTGKRAGFSELDLRTFDAIGWNRSTATASTALNWSTLQSQAKQALATRIGRTVTWIDANQTTAADLLDQDRLNDVNLMLTNSGDIYEGRANKPTGSWQELFSLLDEQGLLDSIEDTHSEPTKATTGNDLLAGSTTNDELSGLKGNDRLIGFKGNDTLCGNKGQDTLFGSLGHDVLIGGKGNDTLMGGAGVDIFAVQRPGLDVVEDFTDGQDKLVLLGGLQFEQLSIQQQGKDTLISTDGNALLLLKNLDATLLTTADLVASI